MDLEDCKNNCFLETQNVWPFLAGRFPFCIYGPPLNAQSGKCGGSQEAEQLQGLRTWLSEWNVCCITIGTWLDPQTPYGGTHLTLGLGSRGRGNLGLDGQPTWVSKLQCWARNDRNLANNNNKTKQQRNKQKLVSLSIQYIPFNTGEEISCFVSHVLQSCK